MPKISNEEFLELICQECNEVSAEVAIENLDWIDETNAIAVAIKEGSSKFNIVDMDTMETRCILMSISFEDITEE
jgi:protein-arginine kinase activator protein McsA